MPEDNEIGQFMFGIRLFTNPDGSTNYEIKSAKDGIIPEIVIMQIKIFLKKLDKDYFNNFKNN